MHVGSCIAVLYAQAKHRTPVAAACTSMSPQPVASHKSLCCTAPHAGPVKAGSPQAGSTTLGTDFSFVCGPGAFVSQFSGVYSTEGLHHLVAGCSNGVLLPRAGGIGPALGDADLAAANFTDR